MKFVRQHLRGGEASLRGLAAAWLCAQGWACGSVLDADETVLLPGAEPSAPEQSGGARASDPPGGAAEPGGRSELDGSEAPPASMPPPPPEAPSLPVEGPAEPSGGPVAPPEGSGSTAPPRPPEPAAPEGTLSPEVDAGAGVEPVAFIASELLGRPTDSSVTVNVIAAEALEVAFDYGVAPEALSESRFGTYPTGYVEAVLPGLSPNTRYYYRMRYRRPGTESWVERGIHSFHTQRGGGSAFTFDIQSDSHQGFAAFHNADLYRVAVENMAADAPDFIVDLGDTFSLDAPVETVETVSAKYLAQRDYLGLVGHSSPLFLVMGNHENEEGWNLDDFGPEGRSRSLPVLGTNARKHYFVNPLPGEFFTGNADDTVVEIEGDHLKEDYYAYEWGDALFVMLDPFWYTTVKPYRGAVGGEKNDEAQIGDRWSWTLGKQQYDWLAETLRSSDRPFKFVFAHHLVGGTQNYSRGGKNGAPFAEWGGYEVDGVSYGFAVHRPGWEQPIHNLFREANVTIFFHGHDHVYAVEELDGIIYQLLPHAASSNPAFVRGFAGNAVNYSTAHMEDNSGYLRVRVAEEEVRVQYVRSMPPGAGNNGIVQHEYVIPRGGDALVP